jgi:uncharacterized protein YukE
MAATSAAVAPAQPPGLGPTTPSTVEDHHDIARDIGKRVEAMILEAKSKSETMVSKEVGKVNQKMKALSAKIAAIRERVNKLDSSGAGPLMKADLQKSIAKLEEVWEGEVGTLKHELWQTIQAHNHNADLLKHHKSAIDQISERASQSVPNPEMESVHEQLVQVDKLIQRESQKEQQLDQLMVRLTVAQQQLNAGGQWGVPSAYPAATPQPQVSTQKKAKAKGKSKAKPANSQAAPPTMRAEAPEFVPCWGSENA